MAEVTYKTYRAGYLHAHLNLRRTFSAAPRGRIIPRFSLESRMARIARELSRKGFLMTSGGGPGPWK